MKKIISLLNCYWLLLTSILSIVTFGVTFFLMVNNDRDHILYNEKIERQQTLIEKQQAQIHALEQIIGL